MTRLEKCEILKSKGYTYDPDTGKIYNRFGKEITRKNTNGYISIEGNKMFNGLLYAHHYAYFMTYGNVDFEILDHINTDRTDNRISNLRIVNKQQNHFNRSNVKGFNFVKRTNKWKSTIKLNGKSIHLGYFNTEEEAKNAYIEAKKKYHII
jgi:hypothetical protein